MNTSFLRIFLIVGLVTACSEKPQEQNNTAGTMATTPKAEVTPSSTKVDSSVTAFAPVKSTVAAIEPEKLPSDVFAMVNDKAITDSVIENKMSSFINDIPPEQVVFARYQIGQRIVMEELVRQAVESGQLVVSHTDLEASLATFTKELEENSMTLEKLLEANRMTKKDFDLQMVVKTYIDSKITTAMKDEMYATIKDQIKEGRVVSIIHKGGPAAKPEDKPGQRRALEDIRAKATGGEPFTELAIKYSDDPNVKDNKGKYPPLFRESQMYPEIIEAAFALAKVGDISQVVETAQGCHLLKLESILLPNRGETHIERLLMQQCGGKLMQEFIQTLHQNSTVVVRKPPQPPQGMMMPPGEDMPPEDPR